MSAALSCAFLVLLGVVAVVRDAWQSRRFRVLPLTAPPKPPPRALVIHYLDDEFELASTARKHLGALIVAPTARGSGYQARMSLTGGANVLACSGETLGELVAAAERSAERSAAAKATARRRDRGSEG
jgi:hypothetical protein